MWFKRQDPVLQAAKKYARALGPRLTKDYGGKEFYSVGQIRTAVRKCELPEAQIALGYAAFLSEAEFAAFGSSEEYRELRKIIAEVIITTDSAGFGEAPVNSYAIGGHRDPNTN